MTPKQQLFVKAYLANGLNATQAAIAAGYSAKTAGSIGEENLKKPEIAAAIALHTEKVLAKLDYGVERVLEQVARMAFFDVRKLYDADGNLKPLHELDEDTAPAIAGVEVYEEHDGKRLKKSGRIGFQAPDEDAGDDEDTYQPTVGRTSKVKLADRGAALDKLMRYHSLYRDKSEVKVSGIAELAEKLAKARARTKK